MTQGSSRALNWGIMLHIAPLLGLLWAESGLCEQNETSVLQPFHYSLRAEQNSALCYCTSRRCTIRRPRGFLTRHQEKKLKSHCGAPAHGSVPSSARIELPTTLETLYFQCHGIRVWWQCWRTRRTNYVVIHKYQLICQLGTYRQSSLKL